MNGVPLRRALISPVGETRSPGPCSAWSTRLHERFPGGSRGAAAQMNLRETVSRIIVEELYQLKFVAESYAEVQWS